MQAFSIADLLVYVYWLSVEEYAQQSFIFVVYHWLAFLVRLPFSYFAYRRFFPFADQPPYSQQISDMEYFIIACLRSYFASGCKNATYFDKQIFKPLNKFRRLKELSDGLGNVRAMESSNGSLLVFAVDKPREFDLVVFYLIAPLGNFSNYVYQEYLMLLVAKLIEQGFVNPVICAPRINDKCTYNDLVGAYAKMALHNAPNVVIAESTSARLCFQMLSQLTITPLPDFVILVSPITTLAAETRSHTDIITRDNVKDWFSKYSRLCKENRLAPNFDWEAISQPKWGFLVAFGSKECAAHAVRDVISNLNKMGATVQVVEQKERLHFWNLTSFYGERLVDRRESSIHLFSAAISRRVLTKEPRFNMPVNIVRVDDSYV